MTIEALSSNEFLNFIIYETISATPFATIENNNNITNSGTILSSSLQNINHSSTPSSSSSPQVFVNPHDDHLVCGGGCVGPAEGKQLGVSGRGRKKRRRKARVCKNKEQAENQRMTHIVVERNRRKQMNEHLSLLRSLMPESYVQRGDQASIVGGAIAYVKELEYILQSLEAQKLQLLQHGKNDLQNQDASPKFHSPPFSQFFAYPQFSTGSQIPNSITSKTKEAIADIEVTLIEMHASVRILSQRNPRQLSKLVAGFQSLFLSILHINVTTMDDLVLYSISAKIEEGCQLTSVDDIAGAVHHMLRLIEESTANK